MLEKILVFSSDLIMPICIALILIYGLFKRVDLFENFTIGAKEGAKTVIHIFPTILGLMIAVGILRASGALEFVAELIAPFVAIFGIPPATVPLTLMRLVSSSAATSLMVDIFTIYGPDSFEGTYVSIMMSCTETIIYTMSIYFLAVKITKTRYTLRGAIYCNIAGVITALILTKLMFK